MKISIITVCFNSAKTIEKTFQSIQNQTYSEIEYIVVDGGSIDQTNMIVDKYATIISKFVSEPDKGLYDAMNKGVKMATGDIVGILNSDDFFYNHTVLEDLANFYKKNSHLDAITGDIVQINQQHKIVRRYSAKKWQPKMLKVGFMPPHPGIFFKRTLFEKYGFYSLDFKIGADYELITRFFLKYNITWKYSGLITTSMLIGGVSSSGWESYQRITKEIGKALTVNDIKYHKTTVWARGLWKIVGLFKR